MKSFIEMQFPISKLSKESYKERRGNQGQSITGMGKWWGRKPLILVKAVIIGLLLPVTSQESLDRDIFLKLLGMDEEGLRSRKTKSIPLQVAYYKLTSQEQERWFIADPSIGEITYKPGISRWDREEIQRTVFSRLTYDEKLEYCDLAEKFNSLSQDEWDTINTHIGTEANNLVDLVQELGKKRFGHMPRIGDAFCGGGSIPFEAARLGCDAYGSDLSPVAAFLTWASLDLIGGSKEVAQDVLQAQQKMFKSVDYQVDKWGIEQNDRGWRADTYIYCNETRCPECGWSIPLAPSWVIAERAQKVIAKLVADPAHKRFNITIEANATVIEIQQAKELGTIKDSALICPNLECRQRTPITMIRGDKRNGLRSWEAKDLIPRSDDIFQERLYCIRWEEKYTNEQGKTKTLRHYLAPDENDFIREKQVLTLLQGFLQEWQKYGYIPLRRIMPGGKTDEPIRTRGWTYWHHLFTPRELLTHGLLLSEAFNNDYSANARAVALLSVGRCVDFNSKLSRWNPSIDIISPTSTNPALNTLFNFGSRSLEAPRSCWFLPIQAEEIYSNYIVQAVDARSVENVCDIWITDPPYADAIVYHELSEYFLAWYSGLLLQLFPDWYTDSKRALAVAGSDSAFRKSMVECYRNLANHMPDNGYQIVMFTHQDADVWADLTLILWASGLRVVTAWCIATETDSVLKEGNYVQGTVLLILSKQDSDETAFLDDIYPQVEEEVKIQLTTMLALEDKEDPNFSDTDYQLAAYAAALRVLTKYKQVEDIDVAYELAKERRKKEASPITRVIADAVRIACDYLVPAGFDSFIWKTLTSEERFYLKGLDTESHGEYRTGAYQELARGFGLKEYTTLLHSSRANQTRLKTATEFGAKMLGDTSFGSSLVRNILFAIREIVRTGEVEAGKIWLHNEVVDYWNKRKLLIEILHHLSKLRFALPSHWKQDAEAARLLAGSLENDHI